LITFVLTFFALMANAKTWRIGLVSDTHGVFDELLASGALGLFVRHCVIVRQSEDRVIKVFDRSFRPIGIVSDEDFLRLLQSSSVTFHTFKTQLTSDSAEEHDTQGIITHALFFQCEEATDLFDIERYPFFHTAQKDMFVRAFAVPLEAFLRLSARLPDKVRPGKLLLLPSTGRCGSTLLGHLVNLHPDIVCISEPMDHAGVQVLASERHASGLRYRSVC